MFPRVVGGQRGRSGADAAACDVVPRLDIERRRFRQPVGDGDVEHARAEDAVLRDLVWKRALDFEGRS